MNFLQNIKTITLTLVIASCLTMSAFAQKSKYGQAGFVGESINLNVVNTDIKEILSYITQEYGINFVIDKSVGKTPVTVNINDVPWNLAMDSILQSQGLAVQMNGPILRVADAKVIADEAATIMGIADQRLNSLPLYTEFIRLNFATASGSSGDTSSKTGVSTEGGGGAAAGSGGAGLLPIIKRRLSRRGAIETDTRSNTLIITDVRENIDAVRQLIALLDQPEPQVEIEARIVIADRTFSRDIGVQIGALALGSRGSAVSAGTQPGGAPVLNTTPGAVPGNVIGSPNGNLASRLANSVIGLTTGVFGTAQLSLLITAGENQGQVKTIATPRVTTLNNRRAEISTGQQIPVTTAQPGSGGGFGVATTTYIDVPLRLEVIPQISDSGTVMLNITAENSSIGPSVSGSSAPSISVQKMKTEVLVPNGGTTVVGGALLDREDEARFSTPGLSKIPIVKNLFRRKAIGKVSSEILFFITPRIYRSDYYGNPTDEAPTGTNRSMTILQPVPLGNPASNSEPQQPTPQKQGNQQPAALPGTSPINPGVKP
jgi:type IV pilus assembly protein PilQ